MSVNSIKERVCGCRQRWDAVAGMKCKTPVGFHVVLFFFAFSLNLLGWHWLIKLYRFQVYISTIHHLYIVLCVPTPSQVSSITIYPCFTLFYVPHPLSLWQSPYCFLCLWVFFLNPFTFSPSLLTPSHLELSVCFLCLWVSFYFVC